MSCLSTVQSHIQAFVFFDAIPNGQWQTLGIVPTIRADRRSSARVCYIPEWVCNFGVPGSITKDAIQYMTMYSNSGHGKQYNNTSSGTQINHSGAGSVVYNIYYKALPQVHESTHLPELYKQIDALKSECLNFAALLDPDTYSRLPVGNAIQDVPSSNSFGHPSTVHDQEYAQEVMFIESHLSSLRGQLEDLETGHNGGDAGWQSAVSRLAPTLQTCCRQMTRCRDTEVSASSTEVAAHGDIQACRELLRGVLIKVDLTILVAPVLYVIGSPDRVGDSVTDEVMRNIRRQIHNVLQRGPGMASAFDPTAAQVEDRNAAATSPGRQELRALIDDDQRTIRAARLEIESIMESVESGSTYYSALELTNDQQQQMHSSGSHLTQEYSPLEERAAQKDLSHIRLPTDIPSPVEVQDSACPASYNPLKSTQDFEQCLSDLALTIQEKQQSRRPPHVDELVLTLDNCDNRGLYQLLILQMLMEAVTRQLIHRGYWRNMAVEPTELFDWIVGSGTGGTIAIMLCKLNQSINQCISVYRDIPRSAVGTNFGRVQSGYMGRVTRVSAVQYTRSSNTAQSGNADDHVAKYATICGKVASSTREGTHSSIILCDRAAPISDGSTILRECQDFSIRDLISLLYGPSPGEPHVIKNMHVTASYGPMGQNPSFIFYEKYYLAQKSRKRVRFVNIGTGSPCEPLSTDFPPSTFEEPIRLPPKLDPSQRTVDSDRIATQMEFIGTVSEGYLTFDRLNPDEDELRDIACGLYRPYKNGQKLKHDYLKGGAPMAWNPGLVQALTEIYVSRLELRQTK